MSADFNAERNREQKDEMIANREFEDENFVAGALADDTAANRANFAKSL